MGTQGQDVAGYKQPVAWQRADDLAVAVFHLSGRFAQDYRWLSSDELRQLEQLRKNTASLLFLLIRSLRSKLEKQTAPGPRSVREEAEITYDP